MYTAAIGPPGCVSTYTFDAAKIVEQQKLDALQKPPPPRKSNGEWPEWLKKDSKARCRHTVAACLTVFGLSKVESRQRRASGVQSTPLARGGSRRGAPAKLPLLTGPQVLQSHASGASSTYPAPRQRGGPRGKPQFMGECRRATPDQVASPSPSLSRTVSGSCPPPTTLTHCAALG